MFLLRSWFSASSSSESARRSIRWMSASFGSCESRQTDDFALAPYRSSGRQSSGLRPPKTALHGGGQSRGLRGFAVFGSRTGSSGTSEWPRFSLGWILLRGRLSALFVLLSAFVALVCSIYAVGYFRHDESNGVFQEGEELGGGPAVNKLREYYALTPLFVFSMILVALANNLGILWVAIEGTTLASVFLVMFYGRETSLEAAWKYAIIGGVGLSMALFGTILTYYSAHQALGTDTLAGLNWSALVGHASQFDKPTMRLAFILILLGYGTKAGIAPMHTWKPDAYSEAPIPGAAMLA